MDKGIYGNSQHCTIATKNLNRKIQTGVSTRYSYTDSFCICCSIPDNFFCLILTMLFNDFSHISFPFFNCFWHRHASKNPFQVVYFCFQ
uniref:Uncharacterized protein n=1 Tax=Anguilla anguilla TaxID=7936 RepID=A0A0E9XDM3_ANGAN